jgi:osmotically-inducible protein OsmY
MKTRGIFIILGCVTCCKCFAYYSDPTPDQPKMHHNQPGITGTSDEDIQKKIWKIMRTDWRPYETEGIAFTVKKGNVTLTGSVETLANKNKIERQIKVIDGVNQIDNKLEVIKK